MTQLLSAEPLTYEAPAWSDIEGTWRQIHGSFRKQGLSIEWHDFFNQEELNWAQSFHPCSLEICLNFSGRAYLQQTKTPRACNREQIAVYATGNDAIKAWRPSGHQHRFVTFEFSADFLQVQLGSVMSFLKPAVSRFLENPNRPGALLHLDHMPADLLHLRLHLLKPPVVETAHDFWYQSKITEILSYLFFEPEKPAELFCERYHRLNQERCERVLFLLERDLENPPSLNMLAQEIQCSPFHLSRIFVQQTGFTIPGYIRRKRLEKAAGLLRSDDKMSITEVAMTVGYSSISSFNKAFVEHFGRCPGLYRQTACASSKRL
ncbi:MAG: hypothetical protein C5B47_07145 [Verrucomicrobia bacterium]|nr:MAG: hypothetical protein C5B47_07145 [Verrucomicrobiota bacterium]